jgi:acyl carrier protein
MIYFGRKQTMDNMEKYKQAFVEAFSISEDVLEGLKYQGIIEWDSVGHMNLVAIIEDIFGITMDTDDIIDFSSFEKGKGILTKYKIEL